MIRRLPVPCVVLAASMAFSACGGAPAANVPVVLISIDTLRADHLGSYGYERDTSPSIDRLAGQSIRFTNAVSQSSWTLPAHASLMTSQYPSTHGVVTGREALSQEALTLAETLKAAGYDTAAFVTWIYVSDVFGFDQGFDEFWTLVDRSNMELASGRGAYTAGEAVHAVESWLNRRRGEPFFLFVHLFDPHMDYDPPPPYDSIFDPDYRGDASGTYRWLRPYIAGRNPRPREIRPRDRAHIEALYDGEIRYMDDRIGALLKTLEETVGLDECLIVLTSDHGEEFGEHGSMEGHGWTLYDEIIRVPLLVRLPGAEHAGTLVDAPVELVDVAPTILARLGLQVPETFQGRSLLGDPGRTGPRLAFSESNHFNVTKRTVRGRRYKLIHTADSGSNIAGVPIQPGYELYDLSVDPGERDNIYAPDSRVAIAFREHLERRSAESVASSATSESAELSPGDVELLRSLGYVQ